MALATGNQKQLCHTQPAASAVPLSWSLKTLFNSERVAANAIRGCRRQQETVRTSSQMRTMSLTSVESCAVIYFNNSKRSLSVSCSLRSARIPFGPTPCCLSFVLFVSFVVVINFVRSVVHAYDHSERKYFASTAVCARHSSVESSFQLWRPLYSLCSEKIPS